MSPSPDEADPAASDNSPLLKADQIAERLSCSGRHILKYLHAGVIPAAVWVKKFIRFREADVMAALEEASRKPLDLLPSEDLVRYAMWSLTQEEADKPGWMHVRESTPEEDKLAIEIAAMHLLEYRELETPEEQRNYVAGVIAGYEVARHADELSDDAVQA